MTTEPYNGNKNVYMISEIDWTAINNINKVRIRYMNYQKITVNRN